MINLAEQRKKQDIPVPKEQIDTDTQYLFDFTIPTNGNIFIQDTLVPISKEDWIDLSIQSQRELFVFDAKDLTQYLARLITNKLSLNTVLLYLGGGAQKVRSFLEDTREAPPFQVESFNIQMRRDSQEIILTSEFKPNQYKKIILVDDVVVTGQSAQRAINSILYRIPEDYYDPLYDIRSEPFRQLVRQLPEIELVTWMGLDPKVRPRKQKSDRSFSTVVLYKGESSLPPCNSLSTLLTSDERADTVVSSLDETYFKGQLKKFVSQYK